MRIRTPDRTWLYQGLGVRLARGDCRAPGPGRSGDPMGTRAAGGGRPTSQREGGTPIYPAAFQQALAVMSEEIQSAADRHGS